MFQELNGLRMVVSNLIEGLQKVVSVKERQPAFYPKKKEAWKESARLSPRTSLSDEREVEQNLPVRE